MLKKFILFTIASLVMLPALADKPDPKPDKGNKGGGGVPLLVLFRDGPGDKFGSDGFDAEPTTHYPYIDGELIGGVDSVSTNISKFRFGLNVTMSGGLRNFFVDLTTGCYVLPSVPLMSCDDRPVLIRTSGITTGGNVFATAPDRAQYLKMSANETDPDHSKDVDFQLEFLDGEGVGWRIMFNPSKCPDDTGATMATVTKISDNPDTWVFEAGALDVACLQLREGGAKHWTFHGLYSLPFQITAYAQPQQ